MFNRAAVHQRCVFVSFIVNKPNRCQLLIRSSSIKRFPHKTFTFTLVKMALRWMEAKKREEKIIFHFVIELIQWKFNFAFLSSGMFNFFAAAHRRVPPTFAFLIFYFVKVSCSCVSLRYLKPVNSQQTHFRPIHPDSVNFSHHDTEEKKSLLLWRYARWQWCFIDK